jgi:hypothetical protein
MSCLPPRKPLLSRDREEWRDARDARRQLLAKVRARRAITLRKRHGRQNTDTTKLS